MKVVIKKGWCGPQVSLIQGCQSFSLDMGGDGKHSLEMARWFAKMFRAALKAHDCEVAAKKLG